MKKRIHIQQQQQQIRKQQLNKEEISIECLATAEYWKRLCPQLTISNKPTLAARKQQQSSATTTNEQKIRQNIINLGYSKYSLTQNNNNQMNIVEMLDVIYKGMQELIKNDWPPYFVCMYDEIWQIANHIQTNVISKMIKSETEEEMLVFNMDFLAWFVESKAGNTSGFAPHRDRQPENVSASFTKDGMAKYVTCWIPVTNATVDNGCLYCIPKFGDDGYLNGDIDGVDPMVRALSTSASISSNADIFPGNNYQRFQNIRALNVDKGNCLLFTHRLIHWSGQVTSELLPVEPVEPRVSLAFAFSDPTYEKPYIKQYPKNSCIPSVEQRLCLAAGQGIAYHKRLRLGRDKMLLFHRIFSKFSSPCLFDDFYRQKIYGEFQWFEFTRKNSSNVGGNVGGGGGRSRTSSSNSNNNNNITIDDEELLSTLFQEKKIEEEKKKSSGLGIFKDIFKKDNKVRPTPTTTTTTTTNTTTTTTTTTNSSSSNTLTDLKHFQMSAADLKQKNELKIREERAKNLFSVFFNEDGSQKITGSDLRNVVPMVCPDYSSVQRMAQGFFGNAKEFECHGKMFGSIAVDLIKHVPLFKQIPEDLPVLQASARHVGIKLQNNHLKSIGHAFNIFLRESCFTFILFFRTIIPTMISNQTSSNQPQVQKKESESTNLLIDMTLHSKRIQQDFDTTVSILESLLPLGELYADPLIDVVDSLFDAAREFTSPTLLSNALSLLPLCQAPVEKRNEWLLQLDRLHGKPKLDQLLFKCRKHVLEQQSDDMKQRGTDWWAYLNSLPQPLTEELTFALLQSISDSSLSHKVTQISRLPIDNLQTLFQVVKAIHEVSITLPDRVEVMAGFCVRLAYRLPGSEFNNIEYQKKLCKQMNTLNRNKVSKRALFIRFLLRNCQQTFIKHEAETGDSDEVIVERIRHEKIRNIRLISYLCRLGMFSHTLLLTEILPKLLLSKDSPTQLDVECACLCLRITGKALDKAYQHVIDGYMSRMIQLNTDGKVKEAVEALKSRRDSNWSDSWKGSESFCSSEEE